MASRRLRSSESPCSPCASAALSAIASLSSASSRRLPASCASWSEAAECLLRRGLRRTPERWDAPPARSGTSTTSRWPGRACHGSGTTNSPNSVSRRSSSPPRAHSGTVMATSRRVPRELRADRCRDTSSRDIALRKSGGREAAESREAREESAPADLRRRTPNRRAALELAHVRRERPRGGRFTSHGNGSTGMRSRGVGWRGDGGRAASAGVGEGVARRLPRGEA
mmetsp:Transcript_10758/g.25838  ORF Transcript_10758/g.25838 Transcript_10758/m.25838 type:complete len:226 (-) Transcript_10758:205-882(-)